MSEAVLKRKTRHIKVPISGIGKNGFSINGGYRNSGSVGTVNLGKSYNRTIYKGTSPVGVGGCCGKFVKNIISNINNNTNDTNYVKRSVMNTNGYILATVKHPTAVFNNCTNSCVKNWVKDFNALNYSQGMFIRTLKIKNMCPNWLEIIYKHPKDFPKNNCGYSHEMGDVTGEHGWTHNKVIKRKEYQDYETVADCNKCTNNSYFIGTKKKVTNKLTKKILQGAISSNDYTTGRFQSKKCLPTPPCKQSFPPILNHTDLNTNYMTPEQGIYGGVLPTDWGTCDKWRTCGKNNTHCIYGLNPYLRTLCYTLFTGEEKACYEVTLPCHASADAVKFKQFLLGSNGDGIWMNTKLSNDWWKEGWSRKPREGNTIPKILDNRSATKLFTKGDSSVFNSYIFGNIDSLPSNYKPDNILTNFIYDTLTPENIPARNNYTVAKHAASIGLLLSNISTWYQDKDLVLIKEELQTQTVSTVWGAALIIPETPTFTGNRNTFTIPTSNSNPRPTYLTSDQWNKISNKGDYITEFEQKPHGINNIIGVYSFSMNSYVNLDSQAHTVPVWSPTKSISLNNGPQTIITNITRGKIRNDDRLSIKTYSASNAYGNLDANWDTELSPQSKQWMYARRPYNISTGKRTDNYKNYLNELTFTVEGALDKDWSHRLEPNFDYRTTDYKLFLSDPLLPGKGTNGPITIKCDIDVKFSIISNLPALAIYASATPPTKNFTISTTLPATGDQIIITSTTTNKDNNKVIRIYNLKVHRINMNPVFTPKFPTLESPTLESPTYGPKTFLISPGGPVSAQDGGKKNALWSFLNPTSGENSNVEVKISLFHQNSSNIFDQNSSNLINPTYITSDSSDNVWLSSPIEKGKNSYKNDSTHSPSTDNLSYGTKDYIYISPNPKGLFIPKQLGNDYIPPSTVPIPPWNGAQWFNNWTPQAVASNLIYGFMRDITNSSNSKPRGWGGARNNANWYNMYNGNRIFLGSGMGYPSQGIEKIKKNITYDPSMIAIEFEFKYGNNYYPVDITNVGLIVNTQDNGIYQWRLQKYYRSQDKQDKWVDIYDSGYTNGGYPDGGYPSKTKIKNNSGNNTQLSYAPPSGIAYVSDNTDPYQLPTKIDGTPGDDTSGFSTFDTRMFECWPKWLGPRINSPDKFFITPQTARIPPRPNKQYDFPSQQIQSVSNNTWTSPPESSTLVYGDNLVSTDFYGDNLVSNDPFPFKINDTFLDDQFNKSFPTSALDSYNDNGSAGMSSWIGHKCNLGKAGLPSHKYRLVITCTNTNNINNDASFFNPRKEPRKYGWNGQIKLYNIVLHGYGFDNIGNPNYDPWLSTKNTPILMSKYLTDLQLECELVPTSKTNYKSRLELFQTDRETYRPTGKVGFDPACFNYEITVMENTSLSVIPWIAPTSSSRIKVKVGETDATATSDDPRGNKYTILLSTTTKEFKISVVWGADEDKETYTIKVKYIPRLTTLMVENNLNQNYLNLFPNLEIFSNNTSLPISNASEFNSTPTATKTITKIINNGTDTTTETTTKPTLENNIQTPYYTSKSSGYENISIITTPTMTTNINTTTSSKSTTPTTFSSVTTTILYYSMWIPKTQGNVSFTFNKYSSATVNVSVTTYQRATNNSTTITLDDGTSSFNLDDLSTLGYFTITASYSGSSDETIYYVNINEISLPELAAKNLTFKQYNSQGGVVSQSITPDLSNNTFSIDKIEVNNYFSVTPTISSDNYDTSYNRININGDLLSNGKESNRLSSNTTIDIINLNGNVNIKRTYNINVFTHSFEDVNKFDIQNISLETWKQGTTPFPINESTSPQHSSDNYSSDNYSYYNLTPDHDNKGDHTANYIPYPFGPHIVDGLFPYNNDYPYYLHDDEACQNQVTFNSTIDTYYLQIQDSTDVSDLVTPSLTFKLELPLIIIEYNKSQTNINDKIQLQISRTSILPLTFGNVIILPYETPDSNGNYCTSITVPGGRTNNKTPINSNKPDIFKPIFDPSGNPTYNGKIATWNKFAVGDLITIILKAPTALKNALKKLHSDLRDVSYTFYISKDNERKAQTIPGPSLWVI